jgi:hypothetical protein
MAIISSNVSPYIAALGCKSNGILRGIGRPEDSRHYEYVSRDRAYVDGLNRAG